MNAGSFTIRRILTKTATLLIAILILLAAGMPTVSTVMAEITPKSHNLDGDLYPGYYPEVNNTSSVIRIWSSLANWGLNLTVFTMTDIGDDLYAGGYFDKITDGSLTDLGGIAKYDIKTNSWQALPHQGLNDDPRAMVVVGDDLYIGGYFTATVDGAVPDLGYIVRYDTKTNTFHALPNQGLNSHVWAMEVVGTDVYVGGNFTGTGDGFITDLGRIVRYDTVNEQWEALPNKGLSWYVFGIKSFGNDLYVGGLFTQTGDASMKNLGHIIRFDLVAETWHEFPNQGLDYGVRAFRLVDDDLYIGGDFEATGDGTVADLGRIVRYNIPTNTWNSLPNKGLNHTVSVLQDYGEDLYVGGWFTQTADAAITDLGFIVRFDPTSQTWNPLPNQGVNGEVNTMVVSGSDIYVGGYFTRSGDLAVRHLGRIARLSIYENGIFLPLLLNQ